MSNVKYEIRLSGTKVVVKSNEHAKDDASTTVASTVQNVSVNNNDADVSDKLSSSSDTDFTDNSLTSVIEDDTGAATADTTTTEAAADTTTTEATAATEVQAGPGKVETEEKGTSGRYTISKVQVKPGRTIETNQDDPNSVNFLSRLPVLKDQAAAYVPMPYVFRVNTACNRIKIQNMWGRCPPFHLLLDHTIAVVWLLFANKEYNCPLGIAQLQWALAFLKTIHTRQGDHPKDVQTCIEVIENILMEQYAQLAADIEGVHKLDETVHYVDGALGSQSMVVKNLPFSLNYQEMISKCPAVAQKESKLSMTSAEAKEELANIKKAAGVQSIESLDTVSKHRAINVLKAWKSEQMEKIRGELKRLRSIEDKMKDIDDNFEGYIEDDLELLYIK